MEILSVDYRGADRRQRFAQSLGQSGFALLTNHPIPAALVDELYRCWLEFFTTGDKDDYATRLAGSQAGYYSPRLAETAKGHTAQDLKEYFHYYPNDILPPELAPTTEEYYRLALALASELLSWIQLGSPDEVTRGFAEPLPTMVEGSVTLLRVLHYPPLAGEAPAGAIRAAAHEDINLLTVLPVGSDAGLEVQTRDGTWMPVPSESGALVVNIGDMLQEASGGYYPSTSHRVVNPTGEARLRSRISAPLFLGPRPEVVLSERYVAGEYLTERLDEIRTRPRAGPEDSR